MSDAPDVRVLFVCMGNICRSPSAEGVFQNLLDAEGLAGAIEIDSAGTHGYHVGRPPDPRAQSAIRKRGIDIGGLRARQVEPSDFAYFDYLLAMDFGNRDLLLAEASEAHRSKVRLFLEFARNAETPEVPDPYYGGDRGFERVLDLIEDASRGFLAHLREEHRL